MPQAGRREPRKALKALKALKGFGDESRTAQPCASQALSFGHEPTRKPRTAPEGLGRFGSLGAFVVFVGVRGWI